MNAIVRIATGAAIACSGIALAAQTGSNSASQEAPVARITVVGCVEPTDQSATQTSESKYKLTHAKSKKNDSTQATGTSGGSSQAANASTYRLDDAKDSTLANDVGQQVEIVAVIEPEPAAPTGTSGSSAAANEPKLKVETVRVIAATCPE
jgi:hypothetical protein